MVKSSSIIKSYKEVIFEIEFHGQFNPDSFSLLWLQKNNILGSKESEEINEKLVLKGQARAFSTPFIDVKISRDTFEVGIIDLQNFDLQLDFALGIMEKISSSISNQTNLNLKFHFENDEKTQSKILNKTIANEAWSSIFENPKNVGLRVEEIITKSNCIIEKTASMSKCYRTDIKYPIHLSIYNEILFDQEKRDISTIINAEFVANVLNSSIETTNKLLKTFF